MGLYGTTKIYLTKEGYEEQLRKYEELKEAEKKISLLYKKQEHKVTYQKMLTMMRHVITKQLSRQHLLKLKIY